jgi:hypothetical protein
MNESQFQKLKQNEKINLTEISQEDSKEKKSFVREEIEVAEYALFGLALGFLVIVCLFYLLNHYNDKEEMIREIRRQIEDLEKK